MQLKPDAKMPYRISSHSTTTDAYKWISARLQEGHVLDSANGSTFAFPFEAAHNMLFLVMRYDPEAARSLVEECNA